MLNGTLPTLEVFFSLRDTAMVHSITGKVTGLLQILRLGKWSVLLALIAPASIPLTTMADDTLEPPLGSARPVVVIQTSYGQEAQQCPRRAFLRHRRHASQDHTPTTTLWIYPSTEEPLGYLWQ